MNISEVIVGKRFRKEMGDLQALADSIRDEGLLQAIGVTQDKHLVFGERRLRACELLGWTEIPHRTVNVTSILSGEYTENTLRKDFTPSERVAIAKAVEVELGERRGRPSGEEKVDKCSPLSGKKTREVAAERAGFGSHGTLRRAEIVVERGIPELVAAMDKGEVSIGAAVGVARLPEPEQRIVLERGAGAIRQNRALSMSNKAQYKHPLIKLENIASSLETAAEAMESMDRKRTAEIPAERMAACVSRITDALKQIRNSLNVLQRLAVPTAARTTERPNA